MIQSLVCCWALFATAPLVHDGTLAVSRKATEAVQTLGCDNEQFVENGILATIGRKVNAGYAIESLHLRVAVSSGVKLISDVDLPQSGGTTVEWLDARAPKPVQVGVVDWRMSNRNEFRLGLFLGTATETSDRKPDWEMVSRWTAGQMAVESTPTKLGEQHLLKDYWEGRTPQLLQAQRFNCGAFALFPFSLLGEWAIDHSPRAYWNGVFARGTYEGLVSGQNGSQLHRAALISRNVDGSVSRVFRLFVNSQSWRVERIEEIGTAAGFNRPVAAVICNSWVFEEVSTAVVDAKIFDLTSLKKDPGSTEVSAIGR